MVRGPVQSRASALARSVTAAVLGWHAFFHAASAASSDFLYDEGQRDPISAELDSDAERRAQAMARFITGIFEEESSGPEEAIDSYRKTLELDPGFTRLAIDVAYDYLRRGDPTEAVGILKDAIKANPKSPEVALALSSIYLRHLRKPELAERYAESALKADPASFGPYEALWEIAQSQGDAAAAMRALERAAKVDSGDAAFWLQLAEFLAGSSDGDPFRTDPGAARIRAALEKAVTFAGDDPEELTRIGDFYVLHDQHELAIPLYEKVAELRPRKAAIHEKLAGCYILTNQLELAIGPLERVIEIDPLNLSAYDRLSILYGDRGDYAKSAAYLEQALIIDKSNWQRFDQLSRLLMVTGEHERAAERLGDARKLFPQVAMLTFLQARALSLAKRHDEAMRLFERAMVEASASQPDLLDSDFYVAFGIAADMAGRHNKAVELLRKAIDLDPTNAAPAYNALGYLWVERDENLEEAEELIRRALRLDPDNGAYIDSLGWLYYRQGKFEESVRELLRAAEALGEPDPVVLDHIGDAYRALEKNTEALLYWQKAAQLDPENHEITEKIDRLSKQVASNPGKSPADPSEAESP